MAEAYVVKQDGLMLDLILWRRYGRRGQDLVEATLVGNPGLAELGPVLPLGTSFVIPDAPRASARIVKQPVSLFD